MATPIYNNLPTDDINQNNSNRPGYMTNSHGLGNAPFFGSQPLPYHYYVPSNPSTGHGPSKTFLEPINTLSYAYGNSFANTTQEMDSMVSSATTAPTPLHPSPIDSHANIAVTSSMLFNGSTSYPSSYHSPAPFQTRKNSSTSFTSSSSPVQDRTTGQQNSQQDENKQQEKCPVVKKRRARRKKTPLPPEIREEKRQVFLEKNRQAARKCREKNRQKWDTIQNNVVNLEAQNMVLKEMCIDLSREVRSLSKLLKEHGTCEDKISEDWTATRRLRAGEADGEDGEDDDDDEEDDDDEPEDDLAELRKAHARVRRASHHHVPPASSFLSDVKSKIANKVEDNDLPPLSQSQTTSTASSELERALSNELRVSQANGTQPYNTANDKLNRLVKNESVLGMVQDVHMGFDANMLEWTEFVGKRQQSRA